MSDVDLAVKALREAQYIVRTSFMCPDQTTGEASNDAEARIRGLADSIKRGDWT